MSNANCLNNSYNREIKILMVVLGPSRYRTQVLVSADYGIGQRTK